MNENYCLIKRFKNIAMKKLLFCAGVLALAASCTEELDTLSVQQEEAAGITFTAVAPQENAATKGEFEEGANGNVWYPFWSAETDQINIYATNVIKDAAEKGGTGSAVTFSTSALETANSASYKATRSERNAYFTASNEVDILDFANGVDEDAPATFLAVYPTDVTLSANANVDWKNGFKVKLDLDGVLTSTQTQTNQQGKGIYELNVKYAVATGYPQASNKVAVGENVPLQFNRILSGLVFKTVGVDPYTVDEDIFGDLASIKVTMDGEYKDGKKVTSSGSTTAHAASKLTYDTGSSVELAIAKDGTIKETPDFKQTSASSTITLTLNQEWSDDARGYMIITPVSRVDKTTKKAWNEGVKVVYTFDKIEFIAPVLETSNSWNANEFIPVPALDINDYPWLVVKGNNNSYATGNNDLTLIINEGADFDEMYDADDETIAWDWDNGGTAMETVDASQIKRIICNIDLTDAQLKTIGSKFTALTDITYNVETSIPAGAFAKQAKNITRLVMPKVTAINKDFSKDGNTTNAMESLEELNLESYQFPSTDINYLLFDGMEDASNSVLKKLNMKAVTDMTAEFDLNRTIAFEGFDALEEVVMGEDVIASQKAFKDCKSLVGVKGSLDLNSANAVNAFENAGSNNTYDPKKPNESFSTINITSDEIPADAFNGASCLVNVLKDGKQVVPTYIGKNAFKGATALVSMDLSKAATIGEDAFNGATSYVGISGQTRLNVEAATIEKGILANTKVVNVYFTNATKVNGPIFTDCTALEQVEFAKTFTAATLAVTGSTNPEGWDGAFGSTSSNVDLFIQNGQSYYNRDNANVLALPEINGKTAQTNEIIFKSIKVRTAAE